MKRLEALIPAIAALVLFAHELAAQTAAQTAAQRAAQTAGAYPLKPIRLIAGAPPGTPADLVARTISEPLAGRLGQPVLVENRPGAILTIALGAVANASPDGYTLGLLGMPATVAPGLLSRMPYDPQTAFAPVRQLSSLANVLVVRGEGPVRSVDDLVAASRQRPGQLTYASGGNGTPAHLAAELFEQSAGIELLHVPFNGATAGVTAVLGGHVDAMFATAPAVAAHLRSGALRALAVTGTARIPAFPATPTMIEAGYPRVTVGDWNGVVAPAGTPPEIVDRLAAAIGEALATQPVRERLAALGVEAVASSGPQPFAALIHDELWRWVPMTQALGIRAD